MNYKFEARYTWILPSVSSPRQYQTHGNVTGDGGKNHSEINTKHTVTSIYRAPRLLSAENSAYVLLSERGWP